VPRHEIPGHVISHSKCINATVYVFDLLEEVVMVQSK